MRGFHTTIPSTNRCRFEFSYRIGRSSEFDVIIYNLKQLRILRRRSRIVGAGISLKDMYPSVQSQENRLGREDTEAKLKDLQWKGKGAESKVRHDEKLLRWIEQQRITMATEGVASSHDNGSGDPPKSLPTPTSPGHRKKEEKTCTPLGPVRSAVSKKQITKRGSMRSTRHDTLQTAETAAADRNIPLRQRILECSVETSPLAKDSTPLRFSRKAAKTVKEGTLLRSFRSQKVTTKKVRPRPPLPRKYS